MKPFPDKIYNRATNISHDACFHRSSSSHLLHLQWANHIFLFHKSPCATSLLVIALLCHFTVNFSRPCQLVISVFPDLLQYFGNLSLIFIWFKANLTCITNFMISKLSFFYWNFEPKNMKFH